MDLTDPQRRALGLYGPIIQLAASLHLTTADMWSAIRDSADEQGLASPGVSLTAVSRLRSIYGGMTAAAEALARGNPDDEITGAMVGQAPWSPALDVQAATPAYLVTYKLAMVDDLGEVQEQWVTSRMSGPLGTVGDLTQDATIDGSERSAKYGLKFAGITGLSIVAG